MLISGYFLDRPSDILQGNKKIQSRDMKRFNIITILCGLVLTSCTITRPLIYTVNPSEVKDLKLLEPYCYITLLPVLILRMWHHQDAEIKKLF
jgi:hypothetical protein